MGSEHAASPGKNREETVGVAALGDGSGRLCRLVLPSPVERVGGVIQVTDEVTARAKRDKGIF